MVGVFTLQLVGVASFGSELALNFPLLVHPQAGHVIAVLSFVCLFLNSDGSLRLVVKVGLSASIPTPLLFLIL